MDLIIVENALPTVHPHSLGLEGFRTVGVGDDPQRPTSPQGCSTRASAVKPPYLTTIGRIDREKSKEM